MHVLYFCQFEEQRQNLDEWEAQQPFYIYSTVLRKHLA